MSRLLRQAGLPIVTSLPGLIDVFNVAVLFDASPSGGVVPATLPMAVMVDPFAAETCPLKPKVTLPFTASGPGIRQA